MMNILLFAQGSNSSASQSGGLLSLMPILVIFFIFYFILILPEQKRVKEHKKMINELKKGDHVLLNSGIYAVVVNVKGDIIEVKIAENVRINVLKSSVSQVIPEEKAKSILV